MKPQWKQFAIFRVIPVLVAAVVAASDPATNEKQSDEMRMSEFTPEHNGREVTISFEVAYTQSVAGLRDGEFPTLVLHYVRKSKSERVVIYARGDLADVLHRLSYSGKDDLKGRTITASGKVDAHEVIGEDGNKLPLYELTLRDWKKFRILRRN
jgi:hypothetical protein